MMMMKNKQMSSKSASFAKGGSTKMHGKGSVGTQAPGVSSVAGSGGGKWASGGSTKMVGKQSVKPAKAC